ncbi:MAG: hypothetical protein D8M58_00840 [Calditrichaeota bacterium]|nr:MAG: hypothetical protein DWQ03_06240 [Calditrichota bacterium]MBL1203913.1 hypothetical protein [Calditrichota bacterium]NOG43746.1 hypothetical protein [Calditrichota bacterium]
MKRLVLLLFVFGLIACGGQKQEAQTEEAPAVEEAVSTVADSAEAVVDSVSSAVEEATQE